MSKGKMNWGGVGCIGLLIGWVVVIMVGSIGGLWFIIDQILGS